MWKFSLVGKTITNMYYIYTQIAVWGQQKGQSSAAK